MTPDEPDVPDIERLWQEFVREAPRFEGQRRADIQQEIVTAIRRARRGHSHMTAVDLWVLVAQCMGCACSEAKATDASWPLPSAYGEEAWRSYEELGFPRKQVRAVRDALTNGWQPRCEYQCGSRVDVVGEGFVVRRTPAAEYFALEPHTGKKPTKWMKEVVLQGFGGRCAGCRKKLTHETATFDHVVAQSKGGLTELTNLQPLCERCAQTKADQDVEVVEAILTFPLRPPPSDGYDGVIW